MDGFATKAALVIGALLLLGLLWLMWKFFANIFKHVVIMLVIGVLGAMLFVYLRYSSSAPRPNSYIGKHAYMKDGGAYLGEVVAEGEDSRRGKVWIVRPLGSRHTTRYSKARVMLKDKFEYRQEPAPSATPESKPAPDKADKDNKKKKN